MREKQREIPPDVREASPDEREVSPDEIETPPNETSLLLSGNELLRYSHDQLDCIRQ